METVKITRVDCYVENFDDGRAEFSYYIWLSIDLEFIQCFVLNQQVSLGIEQQFSTFIVTSYYVGSTFLIKNSTTIGEFCGLMVLNRSLYRSGAN